MIESHQSKVPRTRKELEKLSGVGRKTAGVILNVAFGQPTIPVDTHIFRVANRMGLTKAKNPLETEQELIKIIPKWVGQKAHHLLILHGRYTCKAKKMLCTTCCVSKLCEYPEKHSEAKN